MALDEDDSVDWVKEDYRREMAGDLRDICLEVPNCDCYQCDLKRAKRARIAVKTFCDIAETLRAEALKTTNEVTLGQAMAYSSAATILLEMLDPPELATAV